MTLPDTFSDQRRELAANARGLPESFERALKALAGPCVICGAAARSSDGSGRALCVMHAREHDEARAAGYRRLEHARRQLADEKTRMPR